MFMQRHLANKWQSCLTPSLCSFYSSYRVCSQPEGLGDDPKKEYHSKRIHV